jgi:hypothetical protein
MLVDSRREKSPADGSWQVDVRRKRAFAVCKAAGEVTYHMGLRFAVMALRVEAALTLTLGGGGLEV